MKHLQVSKRTGSCHALRESAALFSHYWRRLSALSRARRRWTRAVAQFWRHPRASWAVRCVFRALSRPPSRAHPPANQFPFKLRDRGEDAEDQPAVRGARVDSLVQTDKMNPKRVEFGQSVHELAERPREPIARTRLRPSKRGSSSNKKAAKSRTATHTVFATRLP